MRTPREQAEACDELRQLLQRDHKELLNKPQFKKKKAGVRKVRFFFDQCCPVLDTHIVVFLSCRSLIGYVTWQQSDLRKGMEGFCWPTLRILSCPLSHIFQA